MDQRAVLAPGLTPTEEAASAACRLCGGTTDLQFNKVVLNKYDVGYHRCRDCHSLQTDVPFWLAETYSTPCPARDTGIVQRNVLFARFTSLLARLLKIDPQDRCLDWGGGNGLFCRMMRDRGMNFHNYDKYVEPFYCIGFSADPKSDERTTLVTAFEVFEHLPEPRTDLEAIFALDPDVIIFSTLLYRGQTDDWSYLANLRGAHVFFYSHKGLAQVGAEFGYDFIEGAELHLFIKRRPQRNKVSAFSHKVITHLVGKGYRRRLVPIFYDTWRERKAHRYQQADREHVEKHIFGVRHN